jgi:hypothetical protein
MLSFGDYLRKSGFLSDVELADLRLIQSYCNDVAAMTGNSARNIEQLSSILALMKLSRPDHEFSGCKLHRSPAAALDFITATISRVYFPKDFHSQHNAASLLYVGRDRHLTVITTNYDLNIEAAAAWHSVGLKVTDGVQSSCTSLGRGQTAARSMYNSCRSTRGYGVGISAELIKLHGSVNWYKYQDRLIVEDMVDLGDFVPAQHEYATITIKYRHHSQPWCGPELAQIVPPTVIKPHHFSQLAEQWREAACALSRATVVLFIGYSFPDSDTYMRLFLATSLHGNVGLRSIYVIDPAAASIVQRIRPLLQHPQHEGCWKAIPLPWEEVPLNKLLDGSWNLSPAHVHRIKAEAEASRVMRGD